MVARFNGVEVRTGEGDVYKRQVLGLVFDISEEQKCCHDVMNGYGTF